MFRFRPRRAMALLTAISLLSFSPCALAESSLYPGAPSISDYSSLSDEEKAAIPLINASHPLPEGFYLPQVEGRAQGGYSVKNGFSPLVNLYAQRHSFRLASSDIWLCRHVYEAAQALFAEAEAQDVNGFIITSGYRSRARQQEIYDETPAGYAALPGQSEHETGLCFDVTAFSDSGDFGSTPQYAWLIANCWDYGFILRYPDGTSDVTGIQGENWHFRYVGVDAAREILARSITLEEYLDGIELDAIAAQPLDGAAGGESAGSVSATMRPAQSATDAPAQTAASAQTPMPTPAPTLEPLITATPTEAVEYAPTTLSGEDISFIDPTYVQRDGESVIYLAGGCFFGLESLMQQIDGVNSAVSGYANGDTVSPGYRDVASGLTGHRETVRVEYDPDVVSLDKLLYAYFAAIDPEQVNRQGHDVGTQYQSGIYYVDSASRGAVNAAADAQREQRSNFAVEIAPLTCFYPAEDYYQDYLEKNPGGYCPIDSDVFDRILSEVNG